MVFERSSCSAGRGRALGALLALALGACAADRRPNLASSSQYLFPVREYEFPSGFRVVIEQDDTAPIAGAVLVVEAGHVDDPRGKSGLAHAAEHLFFRARADDGKSLWTMMPRLGAHSFNAETDLEETTYYAFGPRSSLDELVGTLLMRMADPSRGIDDALFEKELRVVAEELRARGDWSAGGQALAAILPPTDPAARVTAERDQAGALTPADVREFADLYYRPERMTLVISGAIGADWDARFQQSLPVTFRGTNEARRPPIRRPPRPIPAPAPSSLARPTVTASVVGPELWMAWPIPPALGQRLDRGDFRLPAARDPVRGG